jgi:uncharacterized iron-regulated membrane protein
VRVVWVVAGVVPGALFLSGFLMWWNRIVVKARRRVRERQTGLMDEPVAAGQDATTAAGTAA